MLTVYETLQLLKRANLLGDNEIASKLIQLRNENFCYIPLLSQELLSNIQVSSSTTTDEAVNTYSTDLATLRRYYSLHLSDERRLKLPPRNRSNSTYLAEMEFVFGYQRAVLDALTQIWQDAETTEKAIQSADILVYDFYLGRFGAGHFYPTLAVSNDGEMHRASDFVDLCLVGLSFLTLKELTFEQRIERLKSYLQWVENIFHVNLISNTEFASLVVKHLETYLMLSRDRSTRIDIDEEQGYENLFVALQLQLFDYLPDVIKDKLYASPVLKDSFDFKTESVVSVGPFQFDAISLWKGIGAALAGEKATIRPRLVDKTLIIERKGSADLGEAAVTFTDEDGTSFNVAGSVVGLQVPTPLLRLEYLKTLRSSLDCDEESFLRDAELIAAIDDQSERAERFNAWIATSMALSYENLDAQVRNRRGFVFREIEAQPLIGLPAYFRLVEDASAPFQDTIDRAAGAVLGELGLKEALNRFSLFPRKLPKQLIEELNANPISERRDLLKELKREWRSPVGRIHYVYLALTILPEDVETLEAVKQELSRINEESTRVEFEIFETLLDLVEVIVVRTGVADEWTTAQELALTWAHASQLTNIILRLADNKHDELPKLSEFLNSLLPMWYGRVFEVDAAYNRDVLSPRACSRETFFGFALGTLLAGFDSALLEKTGVFDVVKELCFREIEGELLPKYPFWSDISQQSNLTKSWLGSEAFEAFCSFMGEIRGVKLFLPAELAEHVISTAESLASEYSSEQWHSLLFSASGRNLNEKVIAALPAILKNLNFPSLWNEDKKFAMTSLSFLAAQWLSLDDESRLEVQRLLKWVAEQMEAAYATHSPDRFKDEEIQRDTAYQIAQIAVLICRGCGNASETSKRWNETLLDLGSVWPNLQILLEYLFFRLGLEEPLSHIQGLSKNVLKARMMR